MPNHRAPKRRTLLTRKQAGRALHTLRERRLLSQEKLGRVSGVDRPAIGSMERGERWGLLLTYDKLLAGLGATWTELGAELDRIIATRGLRS
jgi:transcriptional regulator with XRE-family HTH domain